MRLVFNEICKLKRDNSLIFVLALTLLPIITGAAGAFIGERKSASDLIFFVNNQFAIFFPMAVVMLAGSKVCQEWRDGTYLTWVTHGIPRTKLLASKAIVCAGVSAFMALTALALLTFVCLILSAEGTESFPAIAAFVPGFAAESLSIIITSTAMGFLIGVLSRNQLIVSAAAVVYGFASCLFIGADWSFIIPGSFAYRIATSSLDPLTYYSSPLTATFIGVFATATSVTVFATVAAAIFLKGRKIER